jgi:hypothetical protein
MNPDQWAKDMVLKLLEATHGQWISQNVQIHNNVAGMQTTLQKEEVQQEIEEQMEMGTAGLHEEDLLDGGSRLRGHGELFKGKGGILAPGHLSYAGSCSADTATDTTDPGGTSGRRALISIL